MEIVLFVIIAFLLALVLLLWMRLQRQNRKIRELETAALPPKQQQEVSLPEDKPSEEIRLTRREMEIVRLCCEGLASKEIAEKLSISPRTVDTHKINIFRKLGVNTTVDLLRWAQRRGILN